MWRCAQEELHPSVNDTCLSVFDVILLPMVLRLGSLGDHYPCTSCGIDDLAVSVVKEVLSRSLSRVTMIMIMIMIICNVSPLGPLVRLLIE